LVMGCVEAMAVSHARALSCRFFRARVGALESKAVHRSLAGSCGPGRKSAGITSHFADGHEDGQFSAQRCIDGGGWRRRERSCFHDKVPDPGKLSASEADLRQDQADRAGKARDSNRHIDALATRLPFDAPLRPDLQSGIGTVWKASPHGWRSRNVERASVAGLNRLPGVYIYSGMWRGAQVPAPDRNSCCQPVGRNRTLIKCGPGS
jgi:hypothetical protein